METYLQKIEAYAKEKAETEQSSRDLGQKAKMAESAKQRAEKEKKLTEEHNSWLQSELEKKSEELFRARQETTRKTSPESRKKIEDLVSEKVRLTKTLATKSEALETVSAKFEKMSNDVVSLKTTSRERDSYEAELRLKGWESCWNRKRRRG